MDYTILNANMLKDVDDNKRYMAWEKFTQVRVEEYRQFVEMVSSLVDESREAHRSRTGSYQPFISIAHDGYDGRRRSIFGITLFFYNPGEQLQICLFLPPSNKQFI